MKITSQIIITILLAIFLIAPWFTNDLFWKFCAVAFIIVSVLVAINARKK